MNAFLHIGPEQTELRLEGDASPAQTLWLAFGIRQMSLEILRHHPPTPLELEDAIAFLEDEVMRVHRGLAPSAGKPARILCGDETLRALMAPDRQAAGAPPVLTLGDVEHWFQRLSAVSLGRPLSQDPALDDPERLATLLIVRELLHHLPCLTEAPIVFSPPAS